MKKRVTFLAALLVAACFGATVAMAEGSAKVTAQSGLNMRQGPGINYNVVTVLNNGATVNVVTPDDGNGWTYVTSGKNAGWVATKYLSGSAATTQAPSWRGSAVNCTVKSDANIRRGPGTDFGVLGVVPAGFTVSADSYQDGWASVTWGDVSGYIATKLLNGLPAANGGTSTASNSTSGRYEGADVTCTLNSDANLRSGPATSYEVLTAVPAGFTVTVHSYANGWSCVTWGDTTGYISNSLINGLPTANGGKGGSSSGSTAGTSWYGGHDYSNVYDYSYYRSQNADLRAAFGNDANAYLQHFVNYGMAAPALTYILTGMNTPNCGKSLVITCAATTCGRAGSRSKKINQSGGVKMTFLFWAATIVVFAIAEAATTALVSIWFAVGAAAAMVASIFTASLGVQCAVFAVVSAVTLAVMLPLLAKRRTMRQPPITNGSPLTIGSRGIVLREIPQGDIGRVRVDGLDWQARTVDGTPLPKDARCEVKNVDGAVLIVSAVPVPAAAQPAEQLH